jgi:hypothetical protein
MTQTQTEKNGSGGNGVQRRRDARITVDWSVVAEKIHEIDQKLPPPLAKVYERVTADPTDLGKRLTLHVRDISVNGAFIEGEALPLLSRVAMVFDVPGFRRVEAVGWVLWRRKDKCTIESDGKKVELGAGFGVVFEWISLDARLEIARRVAKLA